MEEQRFLREHEDHHLDEVGNGELIILAFLCVFFSVSDFFRDRRHALVLLLFCAVAAFVESQLLTNIKATHLVIVGSFVVLWANYTMTVDVCEETRAEELRGIFRKRCWWTDEIRTIGIWLGAIALCVAGIWLAWYVPRGYTVNLAGVAGVFMLVGAGVVISSYLGTRQVVSRRAVTR